VEACFAPVGTTEAMAGPHRVRETSSCDCQHPGKPSESFAAGNLSGGLSIVEGSQRVKTNGRCGSPRDAPIRAREKN